MTTYKMKAFVSVLLVSVFLFSGCKSKNRDGEIVTDDDVIETVEEPEATVKVQIRDIVKQTVFNGQIAPELTEISFPDNGTFSEYKVSMGDKVKKGQVLAVTEVKKINEDIEDLEKQIKRQDRTHNDLLKHYQSEIELLTVQLKGSELDRMTRLTKKQELAKQKILLQQEKDIYVIENEKLKTSLADMQSKVGTNIIVSPVDGVVVALRNMWKGAIVSNLTQYVGIADDSKYYLACEAYMNEFTLKKGLHIYGVKDNKQYEVEQQAMPTEKYNKLKANDIKLHSEFLIKKPDKSMHYGDYMMLVMETARADQVLSLPKRMLKQDTIGKYVYVKKDGEKLKTYVKTGITDGNFSEITDGLKEGDIVYDEN